MRVISIFHIRDIIGKTETRSMTVTYASLLAYLRNFPTLIRLQNIALVKVKKYISKII